MNKLIIGIDPDITKSGVVVKEHKTKNYSFHNFDYWPLYDFLSERKELIKEVRVEAAWLISFNWHKKQHGSAAINAKIGNDTGANHQVGRLIVKMCNYLEIPVVEVRPLKKGWKGPEGKITHDELKKMVPLPSRTNQEQRDACLLIIS